LKLCTESAHPQASLSKVMLVAVSLFVLELHADFTISRGLLLH
jgi:hypothetical protein